MSRPAPATRAPFLRSAAQGAVLHRLVRDMGSWLTIADFGDAGLPALAVRRELQPLVAAGVVERRTDVRPHAFRLPADAPMSAHLAQLVRMTVGVEPVLADRLGSVEGVAAAAIFGSWAAGSVTPTSDVDVLVVLEDDAPHDALDAVHEIAADVGQLVGREIDTMVFRVRELRDKLSAGSGFVRAVVDGPVLEVVGSLGDIRR